MSSGGMDENPYKAPQESLATPELPRTFLSMRLPLWVGWLALAVLLAVVLFGLFLAVH
jgi:hypothetical protein